MDPLPLCFKSGSIEEKVGGDGDLARLDGGREGESGMRGRVEGVVRVYTESFESEIEMVPHFAMVFPNTCRSRFHILNPRRCASLHLDWKFGKCFFFLFLMLPSPTTMEAQSILLL